MMLKRRTKPRRTNPFRHPQHLQWVRGHVCAACGVTHCIEAAHVRHGIPEHEAGGMGMKPHDKWVIPLCSTCHREQHNHGVRTFERKWKIDMKAIAEQLQRRSPHRHRWEN